MKHPNKKGILAKAFGSQSLSLNVARTIADVNRQQAQEMREAIGEVETDPKAKQPSLLVQQ